MVMVYGDSRVSQFLIPAQAILVYMIFGLKIDHVSRCGLHIRMV
jgi:hypothetical protein